MTHYYSQEENRLNFNVELATGEYWSAFHSRGIKDEDLPLARSGFTREAKSDPLLLWKVAEWWFMEGRKSVS